jgi:hypothetical protein
VFCLKSNRKKSLRKISLIVGINRFSRILSSRKRLNYNKFFNYNLNKNRNLDIRINLKKVFLGFIFLTSFFGPNV